MSKDLEKKRKRDSGAVDEKTEHTSKKTILETGAVDASEDGQSNAKKDGKSGKARQMRSERRSKKNLEAKQKSTRSRDKKDIDAVANTDTLETGQDFVPLTDDTKRAEMQSAEPIPTQSITHASQSQEGKSKKSSPRSERKKGKAEKSAEASKGEAVESDLAIDSSKPKNIKETTSNTTKPTRFICFVGNLPFTATTPQIQSHFSKLAPKSIRHSTDKKTGKSKGFAFLEFEDYDRMKTCLKSYHQSIFDPIATAQNGGEIQHTSDQPRRSQGRRINVELTAGGGGNTGNRKEKIREKNHKLGEERERRKIEEKKEAQEKLKKKRIQSEKMRAKSERSRGATGPNAEAVAGLGMPNADTRGDIHPSRLNRVAV